MKHLFYLTLLLSFFACNKSDTSIPDDHSELLLDSLQTLSANIPRANYTDLTFINDTTGFAITDGFIIKTTDGGNNWTSIPMPVNTSLRKIQFTDNHTGYIIGGDNTFGILLKSTDDGNNWSVIHLNSLECPSGMFFQNSKEGFLTGKNLFVKTTDGGATWTNLNLGDFRMFQDVNFKNKNEGYVTSNGGVYYKTTNGGNTWNSMQYKDANYLYNIYFAGDKTLVASSPENLVDFENNYEVIKTPYDAKKLLFTNPQVCIGVGFHYTQGYYSYGDVFVTDNGWKTFARKTYSPSDAISFNAIARMSDHKIMILGGGILNMTVLIFKQ